MTHFLVQSIFGVCVSLALFIGSSVLFIARKNENYRKTLYLLLACMGLVGSARWGLNFCSDTRITVDGRLVDWVMPIFNGIQGILLSIALSILFGLSQYLMAGCAVAVASIAAFAEFMYLGDSDANRKADTMWFCFMVFATIILFVVKAWDVYNHSSPTIWFFVMASLGGIGFLTAEAAAGNAFLHTFPSMTVESWVGWVGHLILFGLIPVGIIIFHGTEPIVNKLIALKHKGKSSV